jgi:hypothetical protein
MALESTTKISGLVATNPTSTDVVSQGDNHLRLIKSVLKSSFPSDVDVQIPDISGKSSHYLTTNSDGNAIEWAEFPDLTALLSRTGELQRPKFQKVDATTLRINPCNYHVSGKGNVNIDSPVELSVTDAGWQYIYIDASEISPTSTFERLSVTASELYASGTAPTYSTGITKRGWYNGEDRCIFAVYVEAGEILGFTHDGGTHVMWDTDRNDGTHNGLSWVTKTLTVPPLEDMVGIVGFFANGTTELNGYDYRYRKPGTSGEHYMGRTEDDESEFLINDMMVQTGNGSIEVNIGRWLSNGGGSGTPTLYIKTRGFLLPGGM